MFSTANITPSPNATRSTSQTPRINSFSTWLDAWNIDIATVVAHNPSRAAELLGYQCLIHSASKHFTISAWLNYDMQFRTLAAFNPQLQWNLHHSELWLDNLASQTGSVSPNTRWPCTYCGSTSHFPDRCPRCPFVQSTSVMTTLLNEIMDLDYSYAEISIIRPANATPAVINTAANTGSPTHPPYRCGWAPLPC